MAKKKLLQDNDGQIWPITTADCVYLSDGSKTIKKYIDDGLTGKANSSHGTHVSYGGNGSATTVSRSDHTHDKIDLFRTAQADDANYVPGANRLVVREFSNDCSNMPSAHYYHIYTGQGSDGNYNSQLAVGMTTESLCFRNRHSGNWTNWKYVSVEGHTHDYLPLSGGTITGNVDVSGEVSTGLFRPKYAVGSQNCYIGGGNGDSASWDTHNMVIRSHWGIGFRDYQDVCNIVFDTRNGNMSTKGDVYSSKQFISEAGLYTNGDVTVNKTITANGETICNGRAWMSNVTLSGMFIGEHKFSLDGVWDDPWYGISCAIKANGSIASTDVIRASYMYSHWMSTFGSIRLTMGGTGEGGHILSTNNTSTDTEYHAIFKPYTGTVAYTADLSDRTQKENIVYVNKEDSEVTYEEMYDFVKDDLELATYDLKNPSEYDEHRKINFIAQDILCNEDQTENKVGNLIVIAQKCMEDQGVLQYDTGNYVSVIAGALKGTINKIEQLENKILELEDKILKLEDKRE